MNICPFLQHNKLICNNIFTFTLKRLNASRLIYVYPIAFLNYKTDLLFGLVDLIC